MTKSSHATDPARQRVAQLESCLYQERQSLARAMLRLEQQSLALEHQTERAQRAEEEVIRLKDWVDGHQDLSPAYEAALEKLENYEAIVERSQAIIAEDEDRLRGLRSEVEILRKQLVQDQQSPPLEEDPQLLQRLAFQDPLTQLPNFHYGLRSLHRLLKAASGTVALLVLDIERLGDLNRWFGVPLCDQILRQLAGRFRAQIAPEMVLWRGPSDEFCLVAFGSNSGPLGQEKLIGQLNGVIQRLLEALKHPFEIGPVSVQLSLVAGAAFAQSHSDSPPEEANYVLECARTALRAGKQRSPRKPLTYFQPEMRQEMRQRKERASQLRQALEQNQFELHFQPIVQLEDLQIQGVECLLRWNHPQEGRLLAGQFLPWALESGLIVPIGEWVAHQLCSYSKVSTPYLWSMNVSAQELMQANFVHRLARTIEAAQLRHPQYLVLEVSALGLVEDNRNLNSALKLISDWGVQVAIDDFTLERCSLAQLSHWGVRYLKLSQELTRLESPLDSSLVRSAAMVAQDLGCIVVAEGVEEMDQLERLRELGCQWGQGHLLQPPIDIQQLWKLLEL